MKKKFALKLTVTLLSLALGLPATCTSSHAQQAPTTPPSLPQQENTSPQRPQPERRGVMGAIFGQPPRSQRGNEQAPQISPTPPTSPSTMATTNTPPAPQPRAGAERLEPDERNATRTDIPANTQANRSESMTEEERSVLPYYNNFLSSYRLGPEDVISITVFNQERYSRPNITIPPDGFISHQLIPGGIFVVGKTRAELETELRTRLDEFIIDPIVTVSLDRAASARYFVVGEVRTPGVRTMTRRLTVLEALAEAGGVLGSGSRSNIAILRLQPDGRLMPIPVNVRDIERGRLAATNFHLVPGDTIVVPTNRMARIQGYLGLAQILSFARMFGGF
jgi:polysaccharide biosynthesis/export protein